MAELLGALPPEVAGWDPLAQDQYIEARTLLSGYLLSSQGDRMLMAHSVEGRFPFLDRDVVALADALPATHKLRVLDEKHVLKLVARDLLPEAIRARKKQPYRAPDARAFAGRAGDYVDDVLSEAAVSAAGLFDPAAVARLARKCRAPGAGPPSNADDMALVGVLSTQLLHAQLVRRAPRVDPIARPQTDVDRTRQARR